MKWPLGRELIEGHLAGVLTAVALGWLNTLGLENPEFAFAPATKYVYNAQNAGVWLLSLALIAWLWSPQVGSALFLTGSALCFVCSFYFLAPGLFQRLVPGIYSVYEPNLFHFRAWDCVCLVALIWGCWISVREIWNSGS